MLNNQIRFYILDHSKSISEDFYGRRSSIPRRLDVNAMDMNRELSRLKSDLDIKEKNPKKSNYEKQEIELLKRDIADLEKDLKYGSHKDMFGFFGPKVSKGASAAYDAVTTFNNLVSIGSQTASAVGTIGSWINNIKSYFREREVKKTPTRITVLSLNLANAVLRKDQAKINNAILELIRILGLGIEYVDELIVIEIGLAFIAAEVKDEAAYYIREILGHKSSRSYVNTYLNYITLNDKSRLESERNALQSKLLRNIERNAKGLL